MLLRFSVSNYKVFKERATLDMEATADRKLEDNLIVCDKYRILKTAAVYGSNASGKTSLFDAMGLMRKTIVDTYNLVKAGTLDYDPFVSGEKLPPEPTVFDIEFIEKGVRYNYGFAYDSESVHEEHFYYYPKGKRRKVFERKGQEFSFGTDGKGLRERNSEHVSRSAIFMPLSAYLNDEVCMGAVDWFLNSFRVICGYNKLSALGELIDTMGKDEEFARLAKKALKIADFGISDVYDVRGQVGIKEDDWISLMIKPMVRVKHDAGGRIVDLPIGSESSGTVRFMCVITPVIEALRNGGTLVLDEMDMSFHTDICKWITGLFLDPGENRKGAQLIFNTHEAGILDQDVMRRDQIWFSVREWETGKGDLRRLSEYRVRSDLDIRKAYLNGSFGTSPFIAPERLME